MKSKILNIIIFLNAFLFINACKKKTPPTSSSNDVVFMFDGKINNNNVLLEAGKNNYFMFTNYYTNSKNILNFEGQLASTVNKDSLEYIKIIFNNYSATNTPSADVMFTPGDYYSVSFDTNNTVSKNAKAVQFQFTGITQNVKNYLWHFGDGDSSTDQNPYHIYTTTGNVNVSVSVTYTTNVQDYLQNTINVSNGTNCQAQFTVTKLGSGDTLQLNAFNTSSIYPTWVLPDTSTTMGLSILYSNPILNRGYITLNDTGGCHLSYTQVVAPKNASELANFNFTSNDTTIIQPINQPTNYRAVVIEYFKNNKKYVSYKNDASINQSTTKVFHLDSKEFYNVNAANQKTIKLNGSINTFLYNISNPLDSISVYSNRIQLAVAFP